VDTVEAVFAPDGALARAMPDFEPRAGQVEMASAVAHVFDEGGVLLAEGHKPRVGARQPFRRGCLAAEQDPQAGYLALPP